MNMADDGKKVSLIGKDISYIQKDIAEIKLSLKELSAVYVTREALAEVAKQTEGRLNALEKSSNLWKWLSPITAAIIAAIIAVIIEYLLIFYLQHVK